MPRRLESRDATVVSVSENGQIMIEQDNPMSDPSTVYLEPGDIPTIVRWLEECAAEAEHLREARNQEAMKERVPV